MLVAEVKGMLQSKIASVLTSMKSLEDRISSLEERDSRTGGPVPSAIQQHAAQITDMRLHIEDLDNRSRRHNIRVRGLREAPDQENLKATLTRLFNMILGHPPDARITMDRAHRVLRPCLRPPPDTPPRDIICRIKDYRLT
ncbi:Hypothetical predicted protein [Pelobates cultripes]|uniref:Uncharacterized protein n=1 Tax=Pelobates cultripes TaxID=61616 RepID=A0AAD1S729_PELCU|nr:Hypothetical predicted protein [Pelobates cultripes]